MINPELISRQKVSGSHSEINVPSINIVGTANPHEDVYNNFDPTACSLSDKKYHLLFMSGNSTAKLRPNEVIDWF